MTADLFAHTDDIIANNVFPEAAPESDETIEPFLNLSRPQCQFLLSLYRVVHPDLEAKVPILFPQMSIKLNEDRQERNSTLAKLERASEEYTQEVELLQEVQKDVVKALLDSDMDTEKARVALKLGSKDRPMKQLSNKELLMNGFLMGGIRADKEKEGGDDDGGGGGDEKKKKTSPLSAPGFREAKMYYDYLLEDRKFSMGGVQLGTFYAQEFKDCQGENCQPGEDPEKVSIEYFEKAAVLGNPMAMHKAGWYYDRRGKFQKAIEWYNKAADEGYPDSAHNLGNIYHEGNPHAQPKLDIDLPKAIQYYNRGLQYGYGPSGTELGRIFFKLSTDKTYRPHLPTSEPNHSLDPKEYMETAISYLDQANRLLEVESLQLLGMIYGSLDFGHYDLDRSQNLFELALMVSKGGPTAFNYLCRILKAKVTLESTGGGGEGGSIQQQQTDSQGMKICAARECDKKEASRNQFQRCGGCKKRYYCSRECQVEDWKKGHKTACKQ